MRCVEAPKDLQEKENIKKPDHFLQQEVSSKEENLWND